ncbi:MAG: SMI1/KNR4 family protein [Lachnospiraceae bacterium]|nr:SMI1/KNR4 family protein [Lachnospiraceae bacterium]
MLISRFKNSNIDVKKEIVSFEKEYGIIIPEQYRKFLLKYNGGHTPNTIFDAPKIYTTLILFYGIGDIEKKLDNIYELSEWIKRHLLPISFDIYGNYIAIGLEGDLKGKIYFCDHEKGYKKTLIANDLSEFFSLCESEKLDIASLPTVQEMEAKWIAMGKGEIITDEIRKAWQAQREKYENMRQEDVVID